jgi:hypothetical protein
MIATLMSFTLVMVVVAGTLAFLSNSTKYSRFEQDVELALKAAEAGIADLLTELRVDPEYFENIILTKDEPTGYCAKQAVGGPAAEADVFASLCGWDAAMAPRWQALGTGEGNRQYYHYAITEQSNFPQYAEVVATGRAGDVYRSVKTTIARETTQRWLAFHNYNLIDPRDRSMYGQEAVYGENMTSQACGGGWSKGADMPDLGYEWETAAAGALATPTKPPRTYTTSSGALRGCVWVYNWGHMFHIGAVHSNDTFKVQNFTADTQLTFSDPRCQLADPDDPSTWQNCVVLYLPSAPAVFVGPAPTYRPVLEMPSVGNAKSHSLAGAGCRYEGPTRIIFYGDHMTVWSKESTEERPGCGSLADLASALGAQNLPIPDDGFIFVDAASGVAPLEIPAGKIGGEPGRELPLGSYTGLAPAAVGDEYTREIRMASKDMVDGMGNLWVEGRVSAPEGLTLGADRSIVVTGDLLTTDPYNDVVGLMGGEGVETYRPMMETVTAVDSGSGPVWGPGEFVVASDWLGAWATLAPGWPTDYGRVTAPGWPPERGVGDIDGHGSAETIRIEAAIYAASYTFGVQNYNLWPESWALELYGAVAENFAGVHATSVGGGMETSDYVYNEKLLTAKPLLFPALGGGAWTVTWQEKANPIPALKEG